MLHTRLLFVLVSIGMLAGALCSGGCESNDQLRMQGRLALQKGDLEQAETKLSRAVDNESTDWESQWLLGRTYLAQNRPLDARSSLARAWAVRGHGPETPQIVDDLAEAHLRGGENDRLSLVLQEAADRYGTAYDFMRQGNYLSKIGDVDNAQLAYRTAARFTAPDDTEPWLKLADLYEAHQDHQKAVEALQTAYRIKPTDPRIERRLRLLGEIPGPTLPAPPAE